MTATVSVEEYIAQRFDQLYQDLKFKDVILEPEFKIMLEDLEMDVIELAQQQYTTEAEERYEEGYEDGRESGVEAGYHDGYDDGYDKGHEDGYEEGFDAGEQKKWGVA